MQVRQSAADVEASDHLHLACRRTVRRIAVAGGSDSIASAVVARQSCSQDGLGQSGVVVVA